LPSLAFFSAAALSHACIFASIAAWVREVRGGGGGELETRRERKREERERERICVGVYV
jgi:hypothetical protein